VPALIRFFVELCLLRRAPQDLPASPLLFRLALVLDLAVGLLVGLMSRQPFMADLLQGLTEIALLLGTLYGALRLTGHPGRFLQTATALLGCGALIGVVVLAPLSLNPGGDSESGAAAFGAFVLLLVVVWNLLVTGHIIRHSFGVGLGVGVAAALGYEIIAITLISAIYGG
jgi:hypothetical protein